MRKQLKLGILASCLALTCLLGVCAVHSATTLKSVKASWYGKNFQNRTMANGKPYNMYAMTAAHKTLPLGTCVQVTSLTNDAEVVVTITDRGPFVRGRTIDVSYAAARLLGIIGKGTGEVLIKVLGRDNDCRQYDEASGESGGRVPPLQRSEGSGQGLCDSSGLPRYGRIYYGRGKGVVQQVWCD